MLFRPGPAVIGSYQSAYSCYAIYACNIAQLATERANQHLRQVPLQLPVFTGNVSLGRSKQHSSTHFMGTLSLCDSSDHKWYLNHGGNSQWQHLNQDRKVEHYLSMIIKFYDKGLGTSLQGQYLRCGRTHLSCAPPPQTADSHRSSRKVTPCLWRVRQVPIKRLAMTLSYLLQCEPDMTWHFTEFQTAQPSHGKFAFTQPSLWPDQIIKSQLHFQKRFFLAGCFAFLFSLPGKERASKDTHLQVTKLVSELNWCV